jgi:hypothetical protein
MYSIDEFWHAKLNGATQPKSSNLDGWNADPEPINGFVEPELTLLEGNPEAAKILIIAAPGAVGKSSFARYLASRAGFAMVDLAKTSPLGGNFFKGGIANAFGLSALSAAASGEIGIVVDALDEAQLRAGPQGYESGLIDLASVAVSPNALPTVLFGRAVAAEDAYLSLSAAGFEACLFQIEFFDEKRSEIYLESKLQVLSKSNADLDAAYQKHASSFHNLAKETRQKLTSVQGGTEARFSGYAPVLDAICEFTLDEDSLNPQARLAQFSSHDQIDLIKDITRSILDREQQKLKDQFKEKNQSTPEIELNALYGPEYQLALISSTLFGSPPPEPFTLSNSAWQTDYAEMVARFSPQHPFVANSSKPANLVFAAYVVVWSLTAGNAPSTARASIKSQPHLISGLLFELYTKWISDEPNRELPLQDVGLLYQALSSQIKTGQRAALEVSGEEDEQGALTINFETLERADQQGFSPQGPTWGPFTSSNNDVLELRSPFSNVFIDAPIWVELGDGLAQQIGAPTEITAHQLTISAKQVVITQATGDTAPERLIVSLSAVEADCQSVQNVTVRDASLAISWPGSKVHPWTNYVTAPSEAPPEIAFMRRRLRKVLTAFRSHSKGDLVRLAAKIDHARMTKDKRGAALIQSLIRDDIITTFDAGKFYVLHPKEMGNLLGVDYQGLQQQRFTRQSDEYLAAVLKSI